MNHTVGSPHHHRRGTRTGGLLALVALAGLAGCGAKEPIPIVFDATLPSPPPASTTPLGSDLGDLPGFPAETTDPSSDPAPDTVAGGEPETSSPAPLTGAWQNATANLAGMASECGNLTMVAAQPATDLVIAGVAAQGLWALDAAGEGWTQLGQGEGSEPITTRASAIVFDPDDDDVFWLSGIYGAGPGVLRTDDGGTTFTALGDVDHSDGISVDLTDPERLTLLSGRHEVTDVRLSHDGGATWNDVSAGLPDEAGFTHFPLVLSPTTLLVGTIHGDEPGIFRSEDAGATWQRTFDFGVAAAPYVDADGTILWVLDGGNGVVRSTDDGRTWELAGAVQLVSNIVDADGTLVAAGPSSLFRSTDGGLTWAGFGPALPFTSNRLAYSAARSAFYISKADCGEVVLDDAIASLSTAP